MFYSFKVLCNCEIHPTTNLSWGTLLYETLRERERERYSGVITEIS